ncbi:MAG: hypothetical protein ABFS46_16885 [Myxococcota bacterium]
MDKRFAPEEENEIDETGYVQCDGECDEKDVSQDHIGHWKCLPIGTPPCAPGCKCLPFRKDLDEEDSEWELVDRHPDDSYDKPVGGNWSYRCWCVKKKS